MSLLAELYSYRVHQNDQYQTPSQYVFRPCQYCPQGLKASIFDGLLVVSRHLNPGIFCFLNQAACTSISSILFGYFHGNRLESEKLPAQAPTPPQEKKTVCTPKSNPHVVAVIESILAEISAGAKEVPAARAGRSQTNSNGIPSVRIAPVKFLPGSAFPSKSFHE
ncbi:hypothetical protein PHYBLDRAFT_151488 [Phycomyces blakesleeanus NRRL 1555(-)]|uniref:Uncharacterized protein n=1 Tax=Phycomyces blakesleeanus (strain ATCC 8743b / DSM 1359 / FGSC 10004 / NBRC 33097 / NRRL 1555) TaxID=763407 RepID=A0A167KA81_PHYB8|nr:hypothetical protein PHYBLDRAFT_151488 [Phycomyces blakesleeanus NRRL 1555(-)]OAD67586.1 hypothetical protein PHYBLDRAFT_151488 [Phycomyces blakesleeanus NRRL 1555(-)]|eukprot:XP_018285626.1 hypothetical protein PHYBLDRAFT_151488 [Phycomyces blakesleeanus NRRL 1555(-)]